MAASKNISEMRDEDWVSPVNPATLVPLGRIAATTVGDVELAVAAAAAAFDSIWSTDTRLRARVLSAWAELLTVRSPELVTALIAETGKPVTEARCEIAGAIEALRYNAGMARHLGGHAGTLSDGTVAHLVREPVGVTVFIAPWNWPILLLLRDLAPALAAGVTAVVKPAPQTSLITRRVVALGYEAGLPERVVQVIVGGAAIGQVAIAQPAVRAVAFTGSTAVGADILSAAGNGMKRPLLELGGKCSVVVFADADLDVAVNAAADAVVVTAGQMCLACTRILADRRCYLEVLDRVIARLSGFVVGDPTSEHTKVGPVISPLAGERLTARLATAALESTLVIGGERIRPEGLDGYFLSPAVITDVNVTSPIVQEELFGPVVTVEPFDSTDAAVDLANATPFGLASAVWTASLDRAWYVARSIRAGTVWVNGYQHSYPEVPSGGYKSSGLGRTRGVAGIEQFTELKHIHFSVAAPAEEGD